MASVLPSIILVASCTLLHYESLKETVDHDEDGHHER